MKIEFDSGDLRPLVKLVALEVLSELESKGPARQEIYTEPEAAEFLRLRPHQLRDLRRAGKISFSRILGRQIRYARADLIAYLTMGREGRS